MKKFYISLTAIILAVIAIVAIGAETEIFRLSSEAEGILGLLVIIPAVLWIFFKGVNFVNAGLYLGGMDYILIKKFLDLEGSVILIAVEAVIMCLVILLVGARKNKQLAEEESKEAAETEESGGNKVG